MKAKIMKLILSNKFFITFILIIIFTISTPLFSQDKVLTQDYNTAVNNFNEGYYSIALSLFLKLEENEFDNRLIYFLIGKCYRELVDADNAIKYLEKYLKNPTSSENAAYAKVNLGYEYLKKIGKEQKALQFTKELVKSKYKNDVDIRFYNAIVYNTIGYNRLRKYGNVLQSKEYYKNTINNFEKALEQRDTLPMIANNLCYTYIRLIEILRKNGKDKEVEEYIEKVNKVLADKKYKNFVDKGKFLKTKNYFKKNILKK